MIKITLKDGSVKEFEAGVRPIDVANGISEGFARQCVAAEINGRVAGLTEEITADSELNLLKFNDKGGADVYRHTASHIMANAIKRLYKGAQLAIGPSIETGFYYDFDIENTFSEADFEKIEAEMNKIIKEDNEIVRFVLPRDEAIALMKELDEPYKVELIEELPEGEEISFYKQGDFTDLCAGPHLPSTGRIKSFKLMQVAGAYWRGSEKNKMLQRIYGTAFDNKKDLKKYLNFLVEAEKRDHRRLGKELELFSINDEIGAGLVLWHPKGARIRSLIEDFWRDQHFKNGYDLVGSPHIGKAHLWETSGHLGFYDENMYAPMNVDENKYYLKPMNCPFHIAIFNSKLYSYRDLPLRWAELGTVYRYEKSGVLHGLLRVRGFTQDDAHIFCRKDQMPEEIRKTVMFCIYMLKSFGFEKFKLYLATKPDEKSVGEKELWDDATAALEKVIIEEGLEYEVDEGGGAFYGPKIDIKIKDALNREWQCSTIQFDFNLPERFDMTFVNNHGEKERPYVIHRALLGSIERFFGVLTEHYEGAFPVWLAPIQAKVLSIAEAHSDYVYEVKEALEAAGVRVEADIRNEKLGYKIREARNQRVPYILVVGDKEIEDRAVAVRNRKDGDIGAIALDDFIAMVKKDNDERVIW
ncbi:MAG: threonine--tRNA ligase [Clostridiales bacterium]|nr:threonine--tRNA ligase [Clostridiales bacterium]